MRRVLTCSSQLFGTKYCLQHDAFSKSVPVLKRHVLLQTAPAAELLSHTAAPQLSVTVCSSKTGSISDLVLSFHSLLLLITLSVKIYFYTLGCEMLQHGIAFAITKSYS